MNDSWGNEKLSNFYLLVHSAADEHHIQALEHHFGIIAFLACSIDGRRFLFLVKFVICPSLAILRTSTKIKTVYKWACCSLQSSGRDSVCNVQVWRGRRRSSSSNRMGAPVVLVETDKEGRTPMRAAFLLNKNDPPAAGTVWVERRPTAYAET